VAISLQWFGLPTCCRAAASIIGQNVGDFQLMFLWGAVSRFEGVCGLPAFSFSCHFISAMMAFSGQEAAATLDRDGS